MEVDMWKEENNKLIRTFEFKNFVEAFSFMTQVALLAEKRDHHPDWHNSYNSVTFPPASCEVKLISTEL